MRTANVNTNIADAACVGLDRGLQKVAMGRRERLRGGRDTR